MLQTVTPMDVPQASMSALVNPAQPSWGVASEPGRDAGNDPGPAGGNPTSPWAVPSQLQSEPIAMPAPTYSLTAAPAAPTWAVSHPNPPSLPPRHPTQGPNPGPPASHPLLGLSSRPASRCEHPLYAHLDLSRPLCLQQLPAFRHPGTSDSYHRSSSPFSAQGQEDCVQQQAYRSVSDAHPVQHQQLHDDSQYQRFVKPPGMDAMHAHQQGHGLVASHPEQFGGQGQPGVTPHNATGVDRSPCMTAELQHGWMPGGVALPATLIACCVNQSDFCLPLFGWHELSMRCASKPQ